MGTQVNRKKTKNIQNNEQQFTNILNIRQRREENKRTKIPDQMRLHDRGRYGIGSFKCVWVKEQGLYF